MTKKKSDNKIINIPVEYVFLVLGLIFGILITFGNPPAQSNDEDRHFYLAYSRSVGDIMPVQNGDKVGFWLPENLFNIIASFQSINYPAIKISRQKLKEFDTISLNPDKKIFYEHPNYSNNPIPYIPSAIGIIIGKSINDNPIALNYSARIGGLIFYLICIFISIRAIPVHKITFMLISLSPMTLFQACSVTYDTMCLSLSFLLIAIAINYTLNTKKLDKKSIIIFLIIAVFHRFAKDGYFLIPFVILMIPKSKFESSKLYYFTILVLIVLIQLPQYTWSWYVESKHFFGVHPFQSDFLFNADLNAKYQLSHPFDLIYNIFMNIIKQGKVWLWGIFARFGYSYSVPNKPLILLHAVILFTFALYDSDKKLTFTKYQRLILAAISLASFLLIMAGFYLVVSPVGANLLFGLQGRYFLPPFPLVLLILANNIFINENFYKWKLLLAAVYSSLVLIYIVSYLDSNFFSI
jgi:uncharacterized membrane protein